MLSELIHRIADVTEGFEKRLIAYKQQTKVALIILGIVTAIISLPIAIASAAILPLLWLVVGIGRLFRR